MREMACRLLVYTAFGTCVPAAWVLDVDLVFGDVPAPLNLMFDLHPRSIRNAAMPFKQGSFGSFTERYRTLFWRAVSMQRCGMKALQVSASLLGGSLYLGSELFWVQRDRTFGTGQMHWGGSQAQAARTKFSLHGQDARFGV